MSTLKVNNIVAYSGTHVSGTFSGVFSGSFNSSRIDALEAFSSSLDNTFATDLVVNSLSGAFNSFTAALDNTYATDTQLLPILQATRSIELTTGSLIGITNGLMAFTASLDNTFATDAQLLPLIQATASIQFATASLNTQTGSQDLVNLGISFVTGSLIGITNGLMAFTASLDNTFATDAQLLPLIHATASIQFATASLNTQTGSQDSVNLGISSVTSSIDAHILKQSIQTGSQDLVNLGISTFTGSLRSEVNSIEAYTASLKGAAIVSSSQQITNYYNFAETASANTFYGNQTITGSLNVTGSVNIDNVIKLTPVTNFPNGEAGMLVSSASYGKTNLYMYDGSDWKSLVTGSIV